MTYFAKNQHLTLNLKKGTSVFFLGLCRVWLKILELILDLLGGGGYGFMVL